MIKERYFLGFIPVIMIDDKDNYPFRVIGGRIGKVLKILKIKPKVYRWAGSYWEYIKCRYLQWLVRAFCSVMNVVDFRYWECECRYYAPYGKVISADCEKHEHE